MYDDTPPAAVEEPVEAEAEHEAEPEPVAAAEPEGEDPRVAETEEEIRFYIGHSMPEQAMAALAKLQTLTGDQAKIDELRAEVDAAMQPAPEAAVETEPAFEEITAEDVPAFEVTEEATEEAPVAVEEAAPAEPVAEPEPVIEPEPEPVAVEEIPVVAAQPEPEPEPVAPEPVAVAHAPEPPAQPGVLKEFVTDLESSLGDDGFLAGTVQKPVTPAAPVAKAAPKAPAQPAPALGEFVADLESSLGEDFLKKAAPVPEPKPAAPAAKAPAVVPPAPVQPAQKPSPLAASAAASAAPSAPIASSAFAAPVASAIPVVQAPKPQPPAPVIPPVAPAAKPASPFGEDAGIDLADMFGELKKDLEADVASSDEDPETHYNLGIAFREMGLLDEAIGELQKACSAFDNGKAFQQIMQAYTWLAQCFLEKGVPEAAVRWYEKALGVPTIDGETRTALNYELAAAYETAGDKTSALKHFMDVYGSNIDYRDVAERIKALKS